MTHQHQAQARSVHTDGAARHDDGFTLVELLIVIVVLGVLATITVFAVRGISERGQENACGAELKNLVTAQEAHLALHDDYVDESVLVSSEILTEESSMYDVSTTAGGGYEIAPASASPCTGSASLAGDASVTPAVPAPPAVTPTSKSFHGFAAWGYGATGNPEVVVFGRGVGEADWLAMINAAPPTSRRVTFINLDNVDEESDLETLVELPQTNGPTDFVLYPSDDTTSIARTGGGTWASVDEYLNVKTAPDPYHHLNGSSSTLEALLLSLG